MSNRVNPRMLQEVQHYGAESASKCFNCGNCTAICGHTDESRAIPRHYIRLLQLGLQERMAESVDPWLCYYCGDCSDTCPREAEPAELMMASRRWLSGTYDWTGITRLLYRFEYLQVVVLALISLAVLLLFTLPGEFGFRLLAQHPEARSQLMLQYFAPMELVHYGDLILAGVVGFVLLTSAVHMWWLVMRHNPAPLSAYIIELWQPIVHMVTQMRWRNCETSSTKNWLRHLFLFTGYGTMFLLVVVFLPWFQVDSARELHFTSLLGYYATLVLLGATAWIISERLRKRDQIHKYSRLADWMFIWLLFLTALSGIVFHLSRLVGWPLGTYVLYMVHLMIAVPIYLAAFGKWSHLIYRPLAIYLEAVKLRALAARTASVPSLAAR